MDFLRPSEEPTQCTAALTFVWQDSTETLETHSSPNELDSKLRGSKTCVTHIWPINGSFTWTRVREVWLRNLQHRRSHSRTLCLHSCRFSGTETCRLGHHHERQWTHSNVIQTDWSLYFRYCPRTQCDPGCVCSFSHHRSDSGTQHMQLLIVSCLTTGQKSNRKLPLYRSEIQHMRNQDIYCRHLNCTPDVRPHLAVTQTLQYAADIASSRNGQQMSAKSHQHRCKHEMQKVFLRRRAVMTRTVLPHPSARAGNSSSVSLTVLSTIESRSPSWQWKWRWRYRKFRDRYCQTRRRWWPTTLPRQSTVFAFAVIKRPQRFFGPPNLVEQFRVIIWQSRKISKNYMCLDFHRVQWMKTTKRDEQQDYLCTSSWTQNSHVKYGSVLCVIAHFFRGIASNYRQSVVSKYPFSVRQIALTCVVFTHFWNMQHFISPFRGIGYCVVWNVFLKTTCSSRGPPFKEWSDVVHPHRHVANMDSKRTTSFRYEIIQFPAAPCGRAYVSGWGSSFALPWCCWLYLERDDFFEDHGVSCVVIDDFERAVK